MCPVLPIGSRHSGCRWQIEADYYKPIAKGLRLDECRYKGRFTYPWRNFKWQGQPSED